MPRSFRGPRVTAWASAFMIFAYLDEFGHIGPYFAKSHPSHNTSPVFGLAGLLLPERSVRSFATFFLNRKIELLNHDIVKSGKRAFEWEKKGTNLFTPTSIERYPEIRRTTFRILNHLTRDGGKIFYYGREKIRGIEDGHATGLYTTVLAKAIRQIDSYCNKINQNYIIVLDEHSARKELLESAAKTMFGNQPAKRLSSPPFEVESYLNQNIQAADWIATIAGRLWNYRLDPSGFIAYQPYETYFWERFQRASTHSTVYERNPKLETKQKPNRIGSLGLLIQAAIQNQKPNE